MSYLKNRIGSMSYLDKKAKQLLKSELVRRGLNNTDLVNLLNDIGIKETKASVDSKISRGNFSATFLLQCMKAIGCTRLQLEDYEANLSLAAEPNVEYKRNQNGK